MRLANQSFVNSANIWSSFSYTARPNLKNVIGETFIKRKTNVCFALTPMYLLVKTNTFHSFLTYVAKCVAIFAMFGGKGRKKLAFHHFWHTPPYLN